MNSNFCENMKIIILLSSIALVLAAQVNPPPRSVNVALETSFLFDPKDVKDNKSLVNNIRGFLDKLYRMIEPQTQEKHFRTETKARMPEDRRLGAFIEVMQNIGQNFLNMTAPKIKEALDTIHVEVKNVTENQQSFLSQVLPARTQYLIKDLINSWITSDPDEIKVFINSTVRENKPLLNTFARRMNTYYNDDDVKKLNKILKKFRRYIDSNKDTTKIVKKLLHNTIFKKYDNLNETAKASVMTDLKMLSEFIAAKNGLTGIETRKNMPNQEVEKVETSDDITYNAFKTSIDEKINNARDKDDDKKKVAYNEIIFGSVELFLDPSEKT